MDHDSKMKMKSQLNSISEKKGVENIFKTKFSVLGSEFWPKIQIGTISQLSVLHIALSIAYICNLVVPMS